MASLSVMLLCSLAFWLCAFKKGSALRIVSAMFELLDLLLLFSSFTPMWNKPEFQIMYWKKSDYNVWSKACTSLVHSVCHTEKHFHNFVSIHTISMVCQTLLKQWCFHLILSSVTDSLMSFFHIMHMSVLQRVNIFIFYKMWTSIKLEWSTLEFCISHHKIELVIVFREMYKYSDDISSWSLKDYEAEIPSFRI